MNRNEHSFDVNPINLNMNRSTFDMSHGHKFSFNVGEAIPFEVMEILPGDTFSYKTAKVIRVQPMVAPIMEELLLDTYYFFCPSRLVWSHFVNFMGENTESAWTPNVEYTVPQLKINPDLTEQEYRGSILDYMAVPYVPNLEFSALPVRAYAKIIDDWFKDQNLQNPVHVSMDETTRLTARIDDQVSTIELGGKPFQVSKLADYFTKCLPAPQRGQDVTFSLSGLAPVYAFENVDNLADGNHHDGIKFKVKNSSGQLVSPANNYDLGVLKNDDHLNTMRVAQNLGSTSYNMVPENLLADLSQLQGNLFSVNQLRQSFAIQRYLEKLARGGSRYTEVIRSFYSVQSPDGRLQRSEYLGGNRLPLNVNQVEQTSATQEDLTPQGNLTGNSFTNDNNSDFTKSFTEHGYIIGICCVRYKHSYSQGIERFWNRKTIYDYYNPTFANLGEMAVKQKEIYAYDLSHNEDIFGYQEAWADYRYKPNRISGEMRPDAHNTLAYWHLADNYAFRPMLGAEWIREDKEPLDRALAVTSQVSNQLIADYWIDAAATRCMPLYSIPGLIDHN